MWYIYYCAMNHIRRKKKKKMVISSLSSINRWLFASASKSAFQFEGRKNIIEKSIIVLLHWKEYGIIYFPFSSSNFASSFSIILINHKYIVVNFFCCCCFSIGFFTPFFVIHLHSFIYFVHILFYHFQLNKFLLTT